MMNMSCHGNETLYTCIGVNYLSIEYGMMYMCMFNQGLPRE